ncbi:MAG TPA: hypothetical protein DCR55_10965 [Lentisphaeria bacterium]|nr:hypothetical protein [Lentisphaeria bacterium]
MLKPTIAVNITVINSPTLMTSAANRYDAFLIFAYPRAFTSKPSIWRTLGNAKLHALLLNYLPTA